MVFPERSVFPFFLLSWNSWTSSRVRVMKEVFHILPICCLCILEYIPSLYVNFGGNPTITDFKSAYLATLKLCEGEGRVFYF